jgi:hypothetical protein
MRFVTEGSLSLFMKTYNIQYNYLFSLMIVFFTSQMQYRNRRRNLENVNMNWREWPQAMPLTSYDATERDLAELMPRVPLNPGEST